MQNIAKTESLASQRSFPVGVVLFAAIITGAFCGLLLADRNVLSVLKEKTFHPVASVLPKRSVDDRAADANPNVPAPKQEPGNSREEQSSKSIPIGLSSIDAIRYSLKSDSALMDVNLRSVSLVGTGVLDSPDRIYVDLQEDRHAQGAPGRLKTRKAIAIGDGPLAGVRVAQWESGALRIVLDLRRSCDFSYQVLSSPSPHLALEIRPRPGKRHPPSS